MFNDRTSDVMMCVVPSSTANWERRRGGRSSLRECCSCTRQVMAVCSTLVTVESLPKTARKERERERKKVFNGNDNLSETLTEGAYTKEGRGVLGRVRPPPFLKKKSHCRLTKYH